MGLVRGLRTCALARSVNLFASSVNRNSRINDLDGGDRGFDWQRCSGTFAM